MIDECLKVAFEVKSDDCPLSDASEVTGTAIDAQPPQRRGDGNDLLKFNAPKNEELRRTLDEDERISFLHVAESDGHDIYRCLSKQPCIIHDLIDGGFLVDALQYQGGSAVFFGAIVDREVLKDVVDQSEGTVTISLRYLYPVQRETEETASRQWNVTDRQEECLRTAVKLGYFSIPRQANADEVAAELGISKSAFLERLRRAEREIFEEMVR